MDYISVAESLGTSSITFTQCAPNATEFAEITKITAITPFKVIQALQTTDGRATAYSERESSRSLKNEKLDTHAAVAF